MFVISLFYYCSFTLLQEVYLILGGLGFEGGVTSKLQGLTYHFYYKLRSQLRTNFGNEGKDIVVIKKLKSKVL